MRQDKLDKFEIKIKKLTGKIDEITFEHSKEKEELKEQHEKNIK